MSRIECPLNATKRPIKEILDSRAELLLKKDNLLILTIHSKNGFPKHFALCRIESCVTAVQVSNKPIGFFDEK